jgi:hypothetical protein
MRAQQNDPGAPAWLSRVAALALAAFLSACGGGDGGSAPGPGTGTAGVPVIAADNLLPIVIDKGSDGTAMNSPYVNVTVCQPGTQNCQTIDHVLVDTGSYGLRIEASALRPGMALPAVNAPGGAPLEECASFASGFTWGSVRTADVRLAGHQASAIPVQVIDDTEAPYASVPADCSNTGAPLNATGSKGILGIGFFARDCGPACAASAEPNVYFSCAAGSGCASTAAPLKSQVANPVPRFAGDNNGVAITLPAVPLGGVGKVAGALVFGVGTRDNNQPGALPVYSADASGNFRTTYQGRTGAAFIDSGSNGIFFSDSAIPSCPSGFYCPAETLSLSATITGINGTSVAVPFQVESAAGVPQASAAAHLAGDLGLGATFDWGLPFFFGRTVFLVFEGATTAQGTGPYWSF